MLLGNHLKALKLPTFACEYEKVAMESAQDRADYPRYLLCVFADLLFPASFRNRFSQTPRRARRTKRLSIVAGGP